MNLNQNRSDLKHRAVVSPLTIARQDLVLQVEVIGYRRDNNSDILSGVVIQGTSESFSASAGADVRTFAVGDQFVFFMEPGDRCPFYPADVQLAKHLSHKNEVQFCSVDNAPTRDLNA